MSVTSSNVEDIYRLTPLQEGILFHSLADPEAGLYVMQMVNPLGRVNEQALRDAWQGVLDRHPVLRTSFHWEGLLWPVQVVHRRVELPFEVRDLRGHSAEESRAEIQRWLLEDVR